MTRLHNFSACQTAIPEEVPSQIEASLRELLVVDLSSDVASRSIDWSRGRLAIGSAQKNLAPPMRMKAPTVFGRVVPNQGPTPRFAAPRPVLAISMKCC